MVCFQLTNLFPYDEGLDSRMNLFEEEGDDVILDSPKIILKLQSCLNEERPEQESKFIPKCFPN